MARLPSLDKPPSLPVVFCDGFSEIDIGDISFYSAIDFTLLLSVLSQKTGTPPHQISVFLDCPKKARASSSPERRRIPITSKVNIPSILRQRDSFLLVMLKRSRKERKRRGGGGGGGKKFSHDGVGYIDGGDPFSDVNPEKLTLLKRNSADSPLQIDASPPYYGFVFPFGFPNLEEERGRYLLAMNAGDSPPVLHRGDDVLCEDCYFAKDGGKEVPFHWCVHDAVTVGFRSRAGPVSRPAKAFN